MSISVFQLLLLYIYLYDNPKVISVTTNNKCHSNRAILLVVICKLK